MGALTPAGGAEAARLALMSLAYLAACLQLVHAATSTLLLPRGSRRRHGATEAAVALHVCLMADLAVAGGGVSYAGLAAQGLVAQGASPLWLNAALALAVLTLAAGERDERPSPDGRPSRLPRPLRLAQAAAMLCCLPPALAALGPWQGALAFADALLFLLTGAWGLHGDHRRRQAGPTELSTAEALGAISVGVLVTDGSGGSTFMNDAMRSQLERCGYPTDLGDLSEVWEAAAARAITPADLGVSGDLPAMLAKAPRDSQRMLVQIEGGEVLLAMRDHATRDGRGTRVFTLDVTELAEASRRLSLANEELERTSRELERQVEQVSQAAAEAAYLDMRASVHDVIGQRVSILQRHLDTGKADAESVEGLKKLVGSILDDLRPGAQAPAAEELRSTVQAFSLADVDIEVSGGLPEDERAARALAHVVREASTNACRHGRARSVRAELGREAGRAGEAWATLRVTDDGAGCPGPVRWGGGLRGMSRSVRELGGELEISPGPPFAVVARVPLAREAGSPLAGAARGPLAGEADGPLAEGAEKEGGAT